MELRRKLSDTKNYNKFCKQLLKDANADKNDLEKRIDDLAKANKEIERLKRENEKNSRPTATKKNYTNSKLPPFGLGIYTSLTGEGLYLRLRIASLISSPCKAKYSGNSSTFMLSIPEAPLLAITFLIARFIFDSFRIVSSKAVMLPFLLFL